MPFFNVFAGVKGRKDTKCNRLILRPAVGNTLQGQEVRCFSEKRKGGFGPVCRGNGLRNRFSRFRWRNFRFRQLNFPQAACCATFRHWYNHSSIF